MIVPLFLKSIEDTSFSTWLREANSIFAFYFILLFHTFGLALLVGANMIVDLRILGVARELPLAPLRRFFPIMWAGFALNVVTGILLVIAYPTKALTNPVFYLKLGLIAAALIVMQKIYHCVFASLDPAAIGAGPPGNAPRSVGAHAAAANTEVRLSETAESQRGKTLAKWSLVLWVAAITAGRLLAYTYTYLLYGHPPVGR